MTDEPLLAPGFWDTFAAERIEANGVRLNVIVGGFGPPLVLVHGMLSTWVVWRRVMPDLARFYRVIVPDLRGFGDSERPPGGYDKTTLARDVLAVLDALRVERFQLVGHDFGAQVAYRMATLARERVSRLAVLEGLLPAVEVTPFPDPSAFWFVGFSQIADLPEALVRGREREYLEFLFRAFLYDRRSVPAAELDEYLRSYAAPGGMRCGFALYRTAAEDQAAFAPEYALRLAMPVLALGGSHSFGDRTLETFAQVADDIRGGTVDRCGHFIPNERPAELVKQLTEFLDDQRTNQEAVA